MDYIKEAFHMLPEPSKSIGFALIEFYETMKHLEKTEPGHIRRGYQNTKVIMTMKDIEEIFKQNKVG
jgi:hypothetical protein